MLTVANKQFFCRLRGGQLWWAFPLQCDQCILRNKTLNFPVKSPNNTGVIFGVGAAVRTVSWQISDIFQWLLKSKEVIADEIFTSEYIQFI